MTAIHWALICMACILGNRGSAYSEEIVITKGDIAAWNTTNCCKRYAHKQNGIRISQASSDITIIYFDNNGLGKPLSKALALYEKEVSTFRNNLKKFIDWESKLASRPSRVEKDIGSFSANLLGYVNEWEPTVGRASIKLSG